MKAWWNHNWYNAAWLWDNSQSVRMYFNFWDKSISRSVFNRYELTKTNCFSQLFGSMRMFVCEKAEANASNQEVSHKKQSLWKQFNSWDKAVARAFSTCPGLQMPHAPARYLNLRERVSVRERLLHGLFLTWLTFDWPVFQLQSRALRVYYFLFPRRAGILCFLGPVWPMGRGQVPNCRIRGSLKPRGPGFEVGKPASQKSIKSKKDHEAIVLSQKHVREDSST
jgi:hypothetical protein